MDSRFRNQTFCTRTHLLRTDTGIQASRLNAGLVYGHVFTRATCHTGAHFAHFSLHAQARTPFGGDTGVGGNLQAANQQKLQLPEVATEAVRPRPAACAPG